MTVDPSSFLPAQESACWPARSMRTGRCPGRTSPSAATRSGWAPLIPKASPSPSSRASIGIRVGRRQPVNRDPLAEPRDQLLSRSSTSEPARAAPPAVPHAEPRSGALRRRQDDGLRNDGRRRPAADAGGDLHPLSPWRRGAAGGDHRATLAARENLGLGEHESEDGEPFSAEGHATACVGWVTRSR